jgi:NAD(P)H-nitrite reductase large subunit
MQTTMLDVYAAGDVAEVTDLLSKEKRVIPIWPNAYNQGSVSGSNMVGNERIFRGGLPMNSIELFGLPTISAGITNPTDGDCEIYSKYEPEKMVYKKVILKDDVIIGSVFVNAIDRAGIITDLIKNEVNVKRFKTKLLCDDFGYVFFPKEERLVRLGA